MMPLKKTDSFERDYNLVWIADVLLHNRWIVLSCLALGMVLALAYSLLTTRIYYADAAVQVESTKRDLVDLDVLTSVSGGPASVAVELELIKSRWMLGKVVEEMQLDITAAPKRFPVIGNLLAGQTEDEAELVPPPAQFLSSYDWGGSKIELAEFSVADDLIDEKFTLTALGGQRYQLAVDGQLLFEAEVGQRVSQQGVTIEVASLHALPKVEFLLIKYEYLSIISRLRSQLSVGEQGRSTGYVVVGLRGENPEKIKKIISLLVDNYVQQNKARLAEEASNSLLFLERQLPVVRADMEKAAAKLNEYQINSGSVNVDVETRAVLEQIVVVDAALSESNLKLAEIERRFTRSHPNYRVHEQQRKELSQRKNELESKVHDLPETQQDVLRLTRDVEVATQIYLMMLSKIQQLDIVRAGTVGSVRLIDSAAVNIFRPVHPKIPIILLAGAMLGFGLGVVIAFFRALLFSRITSQTEIEALSLRLFGNIPLSAAQKNADKRWEKMSPGEQCSRMILSETGEHEGGAEAFRSLRTSVHFHLVENAGKVIAISGPTPNIGKSFTSVNLAVVFAQAGKRVLLIDADMRKGYLHQFFGLEIANPGLSDFLEGTAGVENIVYPTRIDNLCVLPRGKDPQNPSELLMRDNLKSLMTEVREGFDLVIIDTPPIMAVSDALIINQYADVSLLVAKFGYNRISDIQKVLTAYGDNGMQVHGVILNASYKTLSNIQQGEYGYYDYVADSADLIGK